MPADLIPLHRARAQAHQHAALPVGEIIHRAGAICPADQVAGQAVGIELITNAISHPEPQEFHKV